MGIGDIERRYGKAGLDRNAEKDGAGAPATNRAEGVCPHKGEPERRLRDFGYRGRLPSTRYDMRGAYQR